MAENYEKIPCGSLGVKETFPRIFLEYIEKKKLPPLAAPGGRAEVGPFGLLTVPSQFIPSRETPGSLKVAATPQKKPLSQKN